MGIVVTGTPCETAMLSGPMEAVCPRVSETDRAEGRRRVGLTAGRRPGKGVSAAELHAGGQAAGRHRNGIAGRGIGLHSVRIDRANLGRGGGRRGHGQRGEHLKLVGRRTQAVYVGCFVWEESAGSDTVTPGRVWVAVKVCMPSSSVKLPLVVTTWEVVVAVVDPMATPSA